MLRDGSERPEVHMTYSKGHVIRLMMFSDAGRNVTSLQSKFRILTKFSLMLTCTGWLRIYTHLSVSDRTYTPGMYINHGDI